LRLLESKWEAENGDSRLVQPKPDKALKRLGYIGTALTVAIDVAIGVDRRHAAQVRELMSGLEVATSPRHLVKAAVFAVQAAHKPARLYAVR
jgi:hypothetical protein